MKKYLLGVCITLCACAKNVPSENWDLIDFDISQIESDTTLQKGSPIDLPLLPYSTVVIPLKDTIEKGETYTANVFLIKKHHLNYEDVILVGKDTLPRNEAGVGKYTVYPTKAGKQQISISVLSRNVMPFFQTQTVQYWVRSDAVKPILPTRDLSKALAIFKQVLPKQAHQNKQIITQIAQKVATEGHSPEMQQTLRRAKELQKITQQTLKQLEIADKPHEVLQAHYNLLYERYKDLHLFPSVYFAKYYHLQLTTNKAWNDLQIAQKQYQIQQWEKQILINLFYTELGQSFFLAYLPIVSLPKTTVKIGEKVELTVSLEALASQAGSRLIVNQQTISPNNQGAFVVKLAPVGLGVQHWVGKLIFKYRGRDVALPVKSCYFLKSTRKV